LWRSRPSRWHAARALQTVSGYTIVEGWHKSGDTTHLTLSYRDSAGRAETSKVTVSGTPSGIAADREVRIHYDPRSSGHAVIIGLEPSLALPVAFCSLVVLGGFTVLFARVTGKTAANLPKPFRLLLLAVFAFLTMTLLILMGLEAWPHHFTLPTGR
jgi:hypothetical protein